MTLGSRIKIFYDDGSGDGGGGGNPPAPWYEEYLPEGDLRSDPNITKYGSLEDFARGHINQAKLIGKDPSRLVELPGAEDNDGRMALLRRLGAPENVDGYKLTAPEGVDPSLAPEGGLAKMFVGAAAKHGLLPHQAQGIYEEVAKGLHQAIQDDEQTGAAEAQQAQQALRAEWGPTHDQRVGAAVVALNQIAEKAGVKDQVSAEFIERFKADPLALKLFSAVSNLLAEDSDGGERGTGGPGLSPKEAEAKGRELLRMAMQQTDFAEKKRLNEEAAKFFRTAYPEQAT